MVDSLSTGMREKLGDMCSAIDCDKVNLVTESENPVDAVVMIGVKKTGRAVTLGNNIYLPSSPDPSNEGDVALVAHEMTHVFQFQLLQSAFGPVKGALGYFGSGAIDQTRNSLRLGNPYTGSGILEPMAQRVQNCFLGGTCSGSLFTPPGG